MTEIVPYVVVLMAVAFPLWTLCRVVGTQAKLIENLTLQKLALENQLAKAHHDYLVSVGQPPTTHGGERPSGNYDPELEYEEANVGL